MSTYTVNVVGDFRDSFDFSLLNFRLSPLNHSQNIEDVLALAEEKTDREIAVIILCSDKVLREMVKDIGKKINKGRKPWDRVPVVVANPNTKNWQEKIVGFMADVWVFAEKGISEDKTSWIVDLYGTRAKL